MVKRGKKRENKSSLGNGLQEIAAAIFAIVGAIFILMSGVNINGNVIGNSFNNTFGIVIGILFFLVALIILEVKRDPRKLIARDKEGTYMTSLSHEKPRWEYGRMKEEQFDEGQPDTHYDAKHKNAIYAHQDSRKPKPPRSGDEDWKHFSIFRRRRK